MSKKDYCPLRIKEWFSERLLVKDLSILQVAFLSDVNRDDLYAYLNNAYNLQNSYNIGPSEINRIANIMEPEPDYSNPVLVNEDEEVEDNEAFCHKVIPDWLRPFRYKGGNYKLIPVDLEERITLVRSKVIDVPECPDWIYRVNKAWLVLKTEVYYERLEFRQERIKALERDNEKCVVCGTASNIVDHVKPLAHGGENKLRNLQVLCQYCHNEKTKRDFKGISDKTQKMILERDNYKCLMCGAEGKVTEYILPLTKGGTNAQDNLETLCHECLRDKRLKEKEHYNG